MKNNTINTVLVTLIIRIFRGYFIVIDLIFGKDIMSQLKLAEKYAGNKDWNKVLKITREIKISWSKKKHLIMFNFAEAELQKTWLKCYKIESILLKVKNLNIISNNKIPLEKVCYY